ncbi:hypothetical protein [Corynebacterium variabile]|uniref:hypothetical protein n=1 Tax=Corynebacterium variabile TaxID=1727 RepID=UPI003BB1D36F
MSTYIEDAEKIIEHLDTGLTTYTSHGDGTYTFEEAFEDEAAMTVTAQQIILAAGAWAYIAAMGGLRGFAKCEPEVESVAHDILAGKWDKAGEAMGQRGPTDTIGCEILTEYLGQIEADARAED